MNKKLNLIIVAIILIAAILYFYNTSSNKAVTPNLKTESKTDVNASASKKEANNHQHKDHNHNAVLNESEKQTLKKELATAQQILSKDYNEPKYCKNSKSLVFTNKDGNKLFIKTQDQDKPKLLAQGAGFSNNYSWNKNCNEVIYKKRINYKNIFYSYNTVTQRTTELKNIPELTSIASFSASSDTIYYLNDETLQVFAKYGDNSWEITNSDNNQYYGLLPSPDGTKLLAHYSSNICLIDLKTNKETIVGTGIATDWSDDGNYFLTFKDVSDNGHDMTNSDIYVYNVNDLVPNQITNTAQIFETAPFFIDNQTIGFTDAKNGGAYQQQIKLN